MRKALPWVTAACASLAAAALVLHLWDASFRSPWTLGGEDIWSVLAYMKTTLTHLWPTHESLLGAPFGQDLQDYPLGDPLQILLTKLIGLFSGDVAVVTNVFFLIAFPLTALSALWVLRRVGISTWSAVACAVLFAIAPYHFFRSEDHLMIAAYYAVPFSAYLIMAPLADSAPTVRTTVILAALVGAAFTYYAVFTLLLLAFSTAVAFAYRRRVVAMRGALALAVIAAVLALAHVPTWIYHLQHGGNAALVTLHTPEQSERFSLKLPRMLFPVEGHRIPAFARLTQHLDERSPTQLKEGPSQALGLLAGAGFLVLLWLGLTGAFRRRPERDPYLQAAATGATAAFVLGVTGGLAVVIAYTTSPLLRSWSRLSIVIAFFALVAVGKGFDWAGERLRRRGLHPALLALALFGVVALAAADQTSSAMVPDYAATHATWSADGQFTAAAERLLPPGATVLQLPYIPFPEQVYDQARPFLHGDKLRWTFGAMSGRSADWTAALADLPPKTVVTSAAAAGASAVYVDPGSYSDRGRAIVSALTKLLGPPRVVSVTGIELFDLRPYAARIRARLGAPATAQLAQSTLHPVQVLPGPELSAPQHAPNSYASYDRVSFKRTANLDLVNPFPRPRLVDLSFEVTSLGSARTFLLSLPGGQHAAFAAAPTANGRGSVVLRPGHNRMTIQDLTPPAPFEQQYFSIAKVIVQDRATEQLISRAG